MHGSTASERAPLTESGARPRTANGVTIRELAPGESDVLLRVFEGLTPEQRFLRYGTQLPRLPRRYVETLTSTDRSRHVALVAEIGGEPVGITRYVVVGPGTAECAVEVVDACTRRGIARQLLSELRLVARDRGVSRFVFHIQGSNRRALDLAGRAGIRLHFSQGSCDGVMPLRA